MQVDLILLRLHPFLRIILDSTQEGATTDVAAPSCCLPHSAYEKDDPSVAKGRAAFCYTAFFGFFMNTFCQNIKNTAYLSDKRIRKTFLRTLKD